LFKQPHFPEKVAGVQIGYDNFLAIIIFQHHGNGPFDDVIQGIAGVAFVNDGAAIGVSTPMAIGQEVFQIFDMGRNGHERHIVNLLDGNTRWMGFDYAIQAVV
jgi:hypothetical protein